MRRSAYAIRRAPGPCGGSARVAWRPVTGLAVAPCLDLPTWYPPLRPVLRSVNGRAKIRCEIWAWRTRMAIPRRELGRTGLPVTVLGYGAMELRGVPRGRDVTEAQAETILNAVLDAGINYIDTSIDYGLSEERIGRYISHRRSEFYLASKCGCLVGATQAPPG